MVVSRNEIEAKLAEIASVWHDAAQPVAFTGAGISTDSGIPDYRSANGLWGKQPQELATLESLEWRPDEFYYFYQNRIAQVEQIDPNPGHVALARLEKAGHLATVITQNIDNLHQRAGSQNVIELHGSLRTVSCMRCFTSYPAGQILTDDVHGRSDVFDPDWHYGPECICPRCGEKLRPDIIMFGEALPADAFERAGQYARKADFMVVVGSSLTVSPANSFPALAVMHGARLLIINREPTPLDAKATWVIREDCSRVLTDLQERVIKD